MLTSVRALSAYKPTKHGLELITAVAGWMVVCLQLPEGQLLALTRLSGACAQGMWV